MTIEAISAENVIPLTALVVELWTDCSFEEEFDNYKLMLGSQNEICYLAREQEQYITFIHVSIRHDYVEGATEMPVAYIEGIYIKPVFQQQGIAKKLMTVAEEWAMQKGCKQIASDTDLRNAASINFHTKIGFTEVGRIVCFIKNL